MNYPYGYHIMFVRVIPSVKMPIGHAFFDYRLEEGTAHRGDVIMVPFRNRLIPALIADITPTSDIEDKAITLTAPKKILKLTEVTVDLCVEAARECFVSPPTLLNAWLRHVPKRLSETEPHVAGRDIHWPKDKPRIAKNYVVNRFMDPGGIIPTVMEEQTNGRVLVVTPRQKRADHLAKRLGCPVVHADLADGAAWRAWTEFTTQTHGVLVTTRIGAWLSAVADIVIIDEPENDDHKQDELTPRYDSRRIIELATQFNPALRTISVCTTPRLVDYEQAKLTPPITPDVTYVAFQRGMWSPIESLTQSAYDLIEESVQTRVPVRILHAVSGVRGRLRCADCGWTMECQNCGSGMSRLENTAQCSHCKKTAPLPETCAKCGGVNLNKAAIGVDALSASLNKYFPQSDIQVLDLGAWMSQSATPRALFIATNVNMLGGFAEDIRKRERLIIGFRQLASQAQTAKFRLVIQGPENFIQECPSWLTPEGLFTTLSKEFQDRAVFGFPPAKTLVKLILSGSEQECTAAQESLTKAFESQQDWSLSGPYAVEFRPKTRENRCIYHISPPQTATKKDIIETLTPLAGMGILDLDPVAFFS